MQNTLKKHSKEQKVGVLRKKAMTATQMMSFSNKPLTVSLLRSANKHSKIAVECNAKILGWVEKENIESARFAIKQALITPALRDEIYCQSVRATMGNDKTDYLKRAWLMLALCCCCFQPSDLLKKYIAYHLVHSIDQQTEVGRIAAFAMQNLRRTYQIGDRTMTPCDTEVESVVRLSGIKVSFQTLDGTVKSFLIDSQNYCVRSND